MRAMSRAQRVAFVASVVVWLFALWLMGTSDPVREDYAPATAPDVSPVPFDSTADSGGPDE